MIKDIWNFMQNCMCVIHDNLSWEILDGKRAFLGEESWDGYSSLENMIKYCSHLGETNPTLGFNKEREYVDFMDDEKLLG
jgi:hypothetical protein